MSTNITYTPDALSVSERRIAMGQRPLVVWLCGLSGSGKTTAAKEAERRLYSLGYKTYLLDGDNVRHGL
ncbi:MAG: adenylyl-sulfate kinase [Clostridia bacterium]|nr:adenylyl-sulfate kinase [Clostridia bacterium]